LLVTFPSPQNLFSFYCHISVSGRPFVKTGLIPQRYGFGYSLEALLSFVLERFYVKTINLLAPELFFLILEHPVYKM